MREKLLSILNEICPEIDFENEKELVDSGLLDSLSITDIISELSLEYDITIPYEQVIPENFNSIDSMLNMINELNK